MYAEGERGGGNGCLNDSLVLSVGAMAYSIFIFIN